MWLFRKSCVRQTSPLRAHADSIAPRIFRARGSSSLKLGWGLRKCGELKTRFGYYFSLKAPIPHPKKWFSDRYPILWFWHDLIAHIMSSRTRYTLSGFHQGSLLVSLSAKFISSVNTPLSQKTEHVLRYIHWSIHKCSLKAAGRLLSFAI